MDLEQFYSWGKCSGSARRAKRSETGDRKGPASMSLQNLDGSPVRWKDSWHENLRWCSELELKTWADPKTESEAIGEESVFPKRSSMNHLVSTRNQQWWEREFHGTQVWETPAKKN